MKQEGHHIHRVFIITNFDKKDNILKDLYTLGPKNLTFLSKRVKWGQEQSYHMLLYNMVCQLHKTKYSFTVDKLGLLSILFLMNLIS